VSEKYEFVDTTLTEPQCPFPVRSMCRWLDVSASGFYSWRARPDSATARRRDVVKALITEEFTRSDETYGYRRLHAALARRGVTAGRELVRHLTRELGLVPCQPRPSRRGRPARTPRPGPSRTWSAVTSPPTRPAGNSSGTSPTSPPGRVGCSWRR
jgi:putative transposase